MAPAERARRLAALRRHRLTIAHTVARLAPRPDTAPLTLGLAARGRALDRLFAEEAELAVAQVRLLAELDARGEDEASARRAGTLRAEEARLDARIVAEERALHTTAQLFEIRLRGAAVQAR